MKKSRFSPEQITLALHQAEQSSVEEVVRRYGIFQATFYRWKEKYQGMLPSEVRQSRQLEEEKTQSNDSTNAPSATPSSSSAPSITAATISSQPLHLAPGDNFSSSISPPAALVTEAASTEEGPTSSIIPTPLTTLYASLKSVIDIYFELPNIGGAVSTTPTSLSMPADPPPIILSHTQAQQLPPSSTGPIQAPTSPKSRSIAPL